MTLPLSHLALQNQMVRLGPSSSNVEKWLEIKLQRKSRDSLTLALCRKMGLSHLCMLPKVKNPQLRTNIRPISLWRYYIRSFPGVGQRLQLFLPSLISVVQPAFVSEILISENIMIAHEVVHDLRTHPSNYEGGTATKSDMSKAYDKSESCCSLISFMISTSSFGGKLK